MPTDSPIWIYVTAADSEEARRIARTLVDERLLACANVFSPMSSIYRWQGRVCEDNEAAFFGKTMQSRLAQLKTRLPELHSYDCPCLVSGAIDDGLPPFLQWIREQTDD